MPLGGRLRLHPAYGHMQVTLDGVIQRMCSCNSPNITPSCGLAHTGVFDMGARSTLAFAANDHLANHAPGAGGLQLACSGQPVHVAYDTTMHADVYRVCARMAMMLQMLCFIAPAPVDFPLAAW